MKKKEVFLKNIYLKVAQKDDSLDNLVGIRITKNEGIEKLIVIFPIGYNLENESEIGEIQYEEKYQNDVNTLIQCLSMRLNNDETELERKFSFVSAIQIIQDFQTIGLYKENEVERNCEASGKIDWKNTINNSTNRLFWNAKSVLPEVWYKKTNYNYQGKIQQIQRYCLSFVSEVIGPFYNFVYPRFEKPFSDNEMLKLLEDEIQKTNIDNKKVALIHLKNFIKETNCININIENNKILEFGTKKFHTIWEKLVERRFGGISDLRKYNPKAIYLNNQLQTVNDSYHKITPSRPDTIIDYKDDKGLIILDAKYYKIGNLPGEYDINKQLRYAEYCIKNYSNKNNKVYNIFILPRFLEDGKKYEIDSFASNENFYDMLKKGNRKIIIDGRNIVAVCYVDTRKFIIPHECEWKKILDEIINEIDLVYKKLV